MQTLTRPQFLALTDLTVGQFDMMRARNQLPFMTAGGVAQRHRGVYFIHEVFMTLIAQKLAGVYELERGAARHIVAGSPELIDRHIEDAAKSKNPLWYCVIVNGNEEPWPFVSTWEEMPVRGGFNPRDTSNDRLRHLFMVDLTAIAHSIRKKAEKINLSISFDPRLSHHASITS